MDTYFVIISIFARNSRSTEGCCCGGGGGGGYRVRKINYRPCSAIARTSSLLMCVRPVRLLTYLLCSLVVVGRRSSCLGCEKNAFGLQTAIWNIKIKTIFGFLRRIRFLSLSLSFCLPFLIFIHSSFILCASIVNANPWESHKGPRWSWKCVHAW